MLLWFPKVVVKSIGKVSSQVLMSKSMSHRAYSFGHLKSVKSSENGRLCREKVQLPKECEF